MVDLFGAKKFLQLCTSALLDYSNTYIQLNSKNQIYIEQSLKGILSFNCLNFIMFIFLLNFQLIISKFYPTEVLKFTNQKSYDLMYML